MVRPAAASHVSLIESASIGFKLPSCTRPSTHTGVADTDAMRHPAILPDEKTKVLQEAKARAAREAALAAELANEDDDDASPSVVAASPAPPAPPSAPLAPLNVFFRMPTQSDRLL